MFAAMVVNLHGEQTLQAAVIPPILQGPVGVVVAHQEAQVVHLGNVVVDAFQVVVRAGGKRIAPLFLPADAGIFVKQVQVVALAHRPVPSGRGLLSQIHLQGRQGQKAFVVELGVVDVLPVVRKRHNGVALGFVGSLGLLRRERSIREGGVTVQVCFKIAGFRQKTLIFHKRCLPMRLFSSGLPAPLPECDSGNKPVCPGR